jgi:hypothetical protein
MADIRLLHDHPLISDVPEMLRLMADEIERGEHVVPWAVFAYPADNHSWPAVFGWGPVPNDMAVVGLLEMAKTFMVTKRTKRS